MDGYLGIKRDWGIAHIRWGIHYAALYGCGEQDIVRVAVCQHEDQSAPDLPADRGTCDYWGWLPKGESRYRMIQPSYAQFCMCFPYGWHKEAQRGAGMAYRLKITDIGHDEVRV